MQNAEGGPTGSPDTPVPAQHVHMKLGIPSRSSHHPDLKTEITALTSKDAKKPLKIVRQERDHVHLQSIDAWQSTSC